MTDTAIDNDELAGPQDGVVSAALANWFPWSKKPEWISDWEKLLDQAHRLACATTETHAQVKESGMPFWFAQKTAKTKFRACRRYWRLKRRVDSMHRKLAMNLLHELGLSDSR